MCKNKETEIGKKRANQEHFESGKFKHRKL